MENLKIRELDVTFNKNGIKLIFDNTHNYSYEKLNNYSVEDVYHTKHTPMTFGLLYGFISAGVGIVGAPFSTPLFILCMLVTIACTVLVFADLFGTMLGFGNNIEQLFNRNVGQKGMKITLNSDYFVIFPINDEELQLVTLLKEMLTQYTNK